MLSFPFPNVKQSPCVILQALQDVNLWLLQFQHMGVAVAILAALEFLQHLLAMRYGFMAIPAGWNIAVLISMAKHTLKKSMSFVAGR